MIHCTGGGQAKCKNFGRQIHYIKDDLFEMPPLFAAIRENSDISDREMYQDFNMGHRMEIYCSPEDAEYMISTAKSFGVDAKVVGHCERSSDDFNHVTIKALGQAFEY